MQTCEEQQDIDTIIGPGGVRHQFAAAACTFNNAAIHKPRLLPLIADQVYRIYFLT